MISDRALSVAVLLAVLGLGAVAVQHRAGLHRILHALVVVDHSLSGRWLHDHAADVD